MISPRSIDKIADTKAKAAVREQIAADKLARAAKSAREKALRDGTPLPSTSTSSAPVAVAAPVLKPGEKKVYDTTRLQIRLPAGSAPITCVMEVKKTLRDLKEYVVEQGYTGGEIVFSSTFPRLVSFFFFSLFLDHFPEFAFCEQGNINLLGLIISNIY